MITTLVFYFVTFLLDLINFAASLIDLVVPDFVSDTISAAVGYVMYLRPLLPLNANASASGLWASFGIFDILGYCMLLVSGLYLFKLFISLFNILPFIRKFVPVSNHSTKTD